MELVDMRDLKSLDPKGSCGFDSHLGYTIFICMAAYYLIMEDEREFYKKLKERDFDMINKMVKCVLNAIKRKRPKCDIFEITFKDNRILTFTLEKDQYNDLLKNCLNDFIAVEDYETCHIIQQILNKKVSKKKVEMSN